MPTPVGIRLPVIVGEKGTYWCRLRVRGVAGHASQPLRTDNALVKAAEVVRRLAAFSPAADIHDIWRGFVEGMAFPPAMADALLDGARLDELVQTLPIGLARQAHACTHTTFAPTVIHGGTKTNVIPDLVELEVDIRTLPGQSGAAARAQLQEVLGDLADSVEVVADADDESTSSPMDTPLWDTLSRVSSALAPGSTTIPYLTVGATDARFFRRLGVPSYGFGLFSERITYDQFSSMFHGDDERVDQESLRLSTELWMAAARDLLD